MGTFFKTIAWFALWLAAVGATAQAETLRLLTWNVRNYNVCDRLVGRVYRTDYPKPETEKQALRATLRALNADVVALQEMGPSAFLQELQRDLKADGVDYPYAATVQGPDPDRCVSLLSRVPLAQVREHPVLPTATGESVARGLLEVEISTAGKVWTLFVVHLKSRRTTDPKDPDAAGQRRAEAQALWAVVKASARPDYVVAGDFNDNARSDAMRVFTGSERANAASRPRPLNATDSRDEIWTHYYAGGETYDRFDFLVCSPAMAARAAGGRAHVADAAQVLEASDHRPVWADFEF